MSDIQLEEVGNKASILANRAKKKRNRGFIDKIADVDYEKVKAYFDNAFDELPLDVKKGLARIVNANYAMAQELAEIKKKMGIE